jgi:hypothetical protein
MHTMVKGHTNKKEVLLKIKNHNEKFQKNENKKRRLKRLLETKRLQIFQCLLEVSK